MAMINSGPISEANWSIFDKIRFYQENLFCKKCVIERVSRGIGWEWNNDDWINFYCENCYCVLKTIWSDALYPDKIIFTNSKEIIYDEWVG